MDASDRRRRAARVGDLGRAANARRAMDFRSARRRQSLRTEPAAHGFNCHFHASSLPAANDGSSAATDPVRRVNDPRMLAHDHSRPIKRTAYSPPGIPHRWRRLLEHGRNQLGGIVRRRLARCPRQNLGIGDKSVVHGPRQIGQALRSPRLPADHDMLSTADLTQGLTKAEIAPFFPSACWRMQSGFLDLDGLRRSIGANGSAHRNVRPRLRTRAACRSTI